MFKIISGGQKRCKHLKHKWCQLYGQIYKVLSLSDIYVCVPINSYKNIFITFSKKSIYLQHTVVYFICIREYYGQCFPIWKAQFPLQPWKQTALTGVALQWISSLPQLRSPRTPRHSTRDLSSTPSHRNVKCSRSRKVPECAIYFPAVPNFIIIGYGSTHIQCCCRVVRLTRAALGK